MAQLNPLLMESLKELYLLPEDKFTEALKEVVCTLTTEDIFHEGKILAFGVLAIFARVGAARGLIKLTKHNLKYLEISSLVTFLNVNNSSEKKERFMKAVLLSHFEVPECNPVLARLDLAVCVDFMGYEIKSHDDAVYYTVPNIKEFVEENFKEFINA